MIKGKLLKEYQRYTRRRGRKIYRRSGALELFSAGRRDLDEFSIFPPGPLIFPTHAHRLKLSNGSARKIHLLACAAVYAALFFPSPALFERRFPTFLMYAITPWFMRCVGDREIFNLPLSCPPAAILSYTIFHRWLDLAGAANKFLRALQGLPRLFFN